VKRRLEWSEVWGLRGTVQISNLRGQVVDFSREVLEGHRDMDARLKGCAE